MIIPITYGSKSTSASHEFPPQLAKLGSNEIVLIEMQGSLQVEGDPSGQVAGKLKIISNKKATLHVGHQMLEGEIQNLKKPIAVMYKKGGKYSEKKGKELEGGSAEASSSSSFKPIEKAKEEEEEEGEIAEDSDKMKERRDEPQVQAQPQGDSENKIEKTEENSEEGEPISWEIVAIVEKKIVFNKRPVPVSAYHEGVGGDVGGGGGGGGNNKNKNKNKGGGGKNKKRKR